MVWAAPKIIVPVTKMSRFKLLEYEYKVLLREREVLNAREKERRQEVTPPVARTRRARGEVSDDDEGDDDDDANRVGAGAAA